ncbi:MAG: DUF5724 domain-containing protein, partial [Planctomycetota bacterium]
WIEQAWQYLKTAPFVTGYRRTPFRAPKNPEITLETRVEWLQYFFNVTSGFQPEVLTPQWMAAWASHAFPHYQSSAVSPILIVAMNKKGKVGDEVFEILHQTVIREHPIGKMANFVIESLLGSNRTAGWDLIEKTLLAAQRQEGLRQSILESADLAHPESFYQLLRVIVDENLIRFSSVARAVDVWFRLLWDSSSTATLRDNIESILSFVDSKTAHQSALASDDAELVYRALWFTATQDSVQAVKQAKKLTKHNRAEIRYVAAWILHQLDFEAARRIKAEMIGDDNLQVAILASCGLNGISGEAQVLEAIADGSGKAYVHKGYFESIEQLYQRLPEKPTTLKAIVWPWTERKVKRSDLCSQLLATLGDRPPTRLLPYMKGLDAWQKSSLVEILAAQKKWDKLTRQSLIELVGNASADVRSAAFDAIQKKKLNGDEYQILEGYLGRTSADLRKNVVALILKRKDADVLASVQRLILADAKKRLAGLEIVRQLAESDRSRKECIAIARQFSENRKKLSKAEEIQIAGILESDRPVWTLNDGLGLMNPAGRSKVVTPQKRKVSLITKTAIACMKAIDELVHQHRNETIRCKTWNGWHELLLGEVSYELPHLNFNKSLANQQKEFPLWDIWSGWRKNRATKLRDKDQLELLRAVVACSFMDKWEYSSITEFVRESAGNKKIAKSILGEYEQLKLRYLKVVKHILGWLFFTEIPKGSLDYLMDCTENSFAHVTDAMQQKLLEVDKTQDNRPYWDRESDDWRDAEIFEIWKDWIVKFRNTTNIKISVAQKRRLFELNRFWDEPVPNAPRNRLGVIEMAEAVQKKLANKNDLVDLLIGPDRGFYAKFSELSAVTDRSPGKPISKILQNTQGLSELVNQVRERVLEIELARGEKATVSSEAALAVGCYPGIDSLFRILKSLHGPFKVLTGWNAKTEDSRAATLTSMIRSTYPIDGETSADFIKRAKQAIKDGYFSEEQLLQLAFLAPQWNKFVGDMLKWDGFSEGLYWFLAHMDTWRSNATSEAAAAEGIIDEEIETPELTGESEDEDDYQQPPRLSPWERLILERTPISHSERSEGAVDVDWFHRTFELLGKNRWTRMAGCAKLSANSAQAKKAQFVADALLGNTPKSKLVEGIKKRNLKENVRLLGLLPLAKGTKRDKDIVDRYQVLLAYRKYARNLSSLTKPEAFRALEIGMNNLARTAGYRDPLRLEWALEAESTRDLAEGPVSITKEGVTVTLELNEDAKPEITVRRGNKSLKTVPAKIKKKHAAIANLTQRAKELKKNSSRIRQSLESAMCRGDEIEGSELMQLMQHAILAPALQRLVLIGEGIAGYPDKGGKALRDYRGKLEPVKKKEQLRIAHSVDLLKIGRWDQWQKECFQAERVQEYKQIFRELYVPTKAEKGKAVSTRFSGQQIGPKQAMALWGSRGWNTQDEVFKMFHDHSIIASVSFEYNCGTAAEIEGLTMGTVQFQNRDSYKPIKLKDVPGKIFSEVMRDVDLVVSVAHRGEVDPEASESTVELRATLIRETCELLSLDNVKIKKPAHVIIKGDYGEYSVHLGSGNIHRVPGQFVVIVPVHAQHRGRLFLPFADNDPKTAEIVSKVLMLAKDSEVMDPSILEQLTAKPSLRTSTTGKTNGPGKRKTSSKAAEKKRRFELVDGKSNKFWEVERKGDSIVTSWGKIGSKGQTKTKEFADEAKAKAAFEKLIKDKTGKGYNEV